MTKLTEAQKIVCKRLNTSVGFDLDDSGYVVVGRYLFIKDQHESWNTNRYSKTYHRQYGGVKEVSNRQVHIHRFSLAGNLRHIETISFDSWRGNVLLQAIEQSTHFQEVKSKVPLGIRLNKCYDAKQLKGSFGCKLYARTLLGELVDYCAVEGNVTYHSYSIETAIRGLKSKLGEKVDLKQSPINFKLCKRLGFCEVGITTFCETFDLDSTKTYSPEEIQSAINLKPDLVEPFKHELKTVAKAIGCTLILPGD